MALVKIITAGYNSGKTTTAEKILQDCIRAGQRAAGWISEAEYINGSKELYYIRDIAAGRRELAVSAVKPESGRWRQYDISRFYFSDDAFNLVEDIVETQVIKPEQELRPDVVFIDEFGPLEMTKRGTFDAVKRILDNFDGIVYLVVREKLAKPAEELLNLQLTKKDIIRPAVLS